MATFSKIVNVSSTTYATAPDVEFPFNPKLVTVQNLNGGDVAYVSFDGVNDAGALSNTTTSPASCHTWCWQFSRKVWLQTAGSAVVVQVIAET
jgi:hypothetical protein